MGRLVEKSSEEELVEILRQQQESRRRRRRCRCRRRCCGHHPTRHARTLSPRSIFIMEFFATNFAPSCLRG